MSDQALGKWITQPNEQEIDDWNQKLKLNFIIIKVIFVVSVSSEGYSRRTKVLGVLGQRPWAMYTHLRSSCHLSLPFLGFRQLISLYFQNHLREAPLIASQPVLYLSCFCRNYNDALIWGLLTFLFKILRVSDESTEATSSLNVSGSLGESFWMPGLLCGTISALSIGCGKIPLITGK